MIDRKMIVQLGVTLESFTEQLKPSSVSNSYRGCSNP